MKQKDDLDLDETQNDDVFREKSGFSMDDLEQKKEVPFDVDGTILFFKFQLDMNNQESANLSAIQKRLKDAEDAIVLNSRDIKAQERKEQMINALIRVILPGFPDSYLTGDKILNIGKKLGIIELWARAQGYMEKKD